MVTPTATPIAPDTVDIDWTDPKQPRDTVLSYEIIITPVDGHGEPINKTVTPNDQRPIQIGGLTPFKHYKASIYTTNDGNAQGQGGGKGPASEITDFQMWPDGMFGVDF